MYFGYEYPRMCQPHHLPYQNTPGSRGGVLGVLSHPSMLSFSCMVNVFLKGHFTHETESPWPLHFKHSHWWKRRSRSKSTSHYAWGTFGVCECKMDVKLHQWFLHGITWIMFHGHLDYFQKPLLVGKPNTKPGDHGTPNAHNRWLALIYRVRGPIWIQILLK
jgi:hypothetical protein